MMHFGAQNGKPQVGKMSRKYTYRRAQLRSAFTQVLISVSTNPAFAIGVDPLASRGSRANSKAHCLFVTVFATFTGCTARIGVACFKSYGRGICQTKSTTVLFGLCDPPYNITPRSTPCFPTQDL